MNVAVEVCFDIVKRGNFYLLTVDPRIPLYILAFPRGAGGLAGGGIAIRCSDDTIILIGATIFRFLLWAREVLLSLSCTGVRHANRDITVP